MFAIKVESIEFETFYERQIGNFLKLVLNRSLFIPSSQLVDLALNEFFPSLVRFYIQILRHLLRRETPVFHKK
jgi:hypothetical protein